MPTQQENPPNLPAWGDRALCIATMLLAAVVTLLVRWLNLADELWLDELHSSWVVTDSFADIVPRAGIGNQTPLWFWLVWPIYHGLGPSEFSLRLISWLASAGLAAVAVEMVWRWRPAGAASPLMPALAVAGLIAFDPTFIFYGTEARPYACLQLVAALRLRTVWSLSAGAGRGARVAHALLGVVMLWLHLTGGLILAGEWAALAVWRAQGRRDYRWRDAALDTTLVLASLVPLMWLLGLIYHRRQNWTFVPDLSLAGFGDLVRFWTLLAPATGIAIGAWIADWACAPREPKPVEQMPQSPWDEPGPKAEAAIREPMLARWRKHFAGAAWPGLSIAAAPAAWTLATLATAALLQGFGFAPLFFGRYLIGVSVGGVIAAAMGTYGFRTKLVVWIAPIALFFASLHATGMLERLVLSLSILVEKQEVALEPLLSPRSTFDTHDLHATWDDEFWPVLVRLNLVENAKPDDWSGGLRAEYDTFALRGLYRPINLKLLHALNPHWPTNSVDVASNPATIDAIKTEGRFRVVMPESAETPQVLEARVGDVRCQLRFRNRFAGYVQYECNDFPRSN